MNQTPKFVASTTLDDVTWANSTLLDGDVPKAVADLKAIDGKDITINGSRHARPLAAPRGAGRRAAADDPSGHRRQRQAPVPGRGRASLEPVDATPFKTGVIYARYAPATG